MRLLVTGGAGFVGSAFIRHALADTRVSSLVNVDKLTYAGSLDNLAPAAGDARYRFVQADICDARKMNALFREERPEVVVHFAAESHVDRSILAPAPVFESNVRGTFVLLEAARRHTPRRFVHVSTDEVYGSLEEPLEADELFPLGPTNVYSASKASSDLMALAYAATYGVPVIVTRASNNYGPHQHPEKLIPLMVSHAAADKPLPVYGDGQHVRDWLYVDDHCRALQAVIERGRPGEIYNVGGGCTLTNLDVIRSILRLTGRPESLIRFIQDRPGHDRRYALSSEKLTRETAWTPSVPFHDGLCRTVAWYREHPEWVSRLTSGEFSQYYTTNYERRSIELRRTRPAGSWPPPPPQHRVQGARP